MSEISLISTTALKTISDETKSLDLLAESVGESFEQIVELIHQSEGKIVVTGIGKSGIVAMKIAATLSSTGSPATFMHGADASHGDMGIIEKKDVVIALSKSGNTKEVKDLIPFIKNNGNVLIGMTANPSSFLGAQSDHILFTPVEKEACPHNLAPTTSTTVHASKDLPAILTSSEKETVVFLLAPVLHRSPYRTNPPTTFLPRAEGRE